MAESLQGPERAQRLAEAAAAHEAVLKVRTREALPQDWAATQNNLANVLYSQACSEGDKPGPGCWPEAGAYRAALEVYTRQDAAPGLGDDAEQPGQRARPGAAAPGPSGARLLAESVAAYRGALEVRTREADPQRWATTQSSMALTLLAQASRSTGAERARLLAESVAACRAALEVRTREALPQDWAVTQENLADALEGHSPRMPRSPPAPRSRTRRPPPGRRPAPSARARSARKRGEPELHLQRVSEAVAPEAA